MSNNYRISSSFNFETPSIKSLIKLKIKFKRGSPSKKALILDSYF
jgi:hypothetical protein